MGMFKKAERSQMYLKIAMTGVSGSGKTYSAIQLAKGLVEGTDGKIALLDTENGSASAYSDLGDYDVCDLEPPFTPKKYIDIIHEAEKEGYKVLIIDSLSHAWSGDGGILDMVDKKSSAGNNRNGFAAWRSVTPEHNKLIDSILQSKMDVIVCMRSKQAYEIVETNGKKVPTKMGLAPVQRDGVEYEFTIVFDLSIEKHLATASKDRTGLFDNEIGVITPDVGKRIREWNNGGAPLKPKKLADVEVPEELIEVPPTHMDNFVTIVGDICWVKTQQGKVDIRTLNDEQLKVMKNHKNYVAAKECIEKLLSEKQQQ